MHLSQVLAFSTLLASQAMLVVASQQRSNILRGNAVHHHAALQKRTVPNSRSRRSVALNDFVEGLYEDFADAEKCEPDTPSNAGKKSKKKTKKGSKKQRLPNDRTLAASTPANATLSVDAAPSAPSTVSNITSASNTKTGCFPGLKKSPAIPSTKATKEILSDWFCDQKDEYAFMGFSYDLTGCPDLNKLKNDFTNMRKTFHARYVRLYGACGDVDNYDNLVEAASSAGIGIYGLVWFGFDGDDKWKGRLAAIKKVIQTNQKAPYIIRNIAIGSEPLFDGVLPVDEIAKVILQTKKELAPFGTQITLSDMPFGYQQAGDAPEVFKAVDLLEVNALPFFDSDASTGSQAWGSVSFMMDYMHQHGQKGQILRLTQTGWPSDESVWKSNNGKAEASVSSEQGYFDLLDSKCSTFKASSTGWFAQIYDDDMLGGWGILKDGKPKFAFKPKVTC